VFFCGCGKTTLGEESELLFVLVKICKLSTTSGFMSPSGYSIGFISSAGISTKVISTGSSWGTFVTRLPIPEASNPISRVNEPIKL
jgi:hypothetical protein